MPLATVNAAPTTIPNRNGRRFVALVMETDLIAPAPVRNRSIPEVQHFFEARAKRSDWFRRAARDRPIPGLGWKADAICQLLDS